MMDATTAREARRRRILQNSGSRIDRILGVEGRTNEPCLDGAPSVKTGAVLEKLGREDVNPVLGGEDLPELNNAGHKSKKRRLTTNQKQMLKYRGTITWRLSIFCALISHYIFTIPALILCLISEIVCELVIYTLLDDENMTSDLLRLIPRELQELLPMRQDYIRTISLTWTKLRRVIQNISLMMFAFIITEYILLNVDEVVSVFIACLY